MKVNGLTVLCVVVLLLGITLPLAAGQTNAISLGTFSEPFTTFSMTGELTYPGEMDWYTFDTVSESATTFILAEGNTGDAGIRVLLYDGEERFVAAADDGFLESVLNVGTYYIRIDSINSTVQSYSLVVLNGLESESNDGLVESNDLGEISGWVSLFASASPAGDADFYRFQIAETGLPDEANAILIKTDGPTPGDTLLVLYRYDGVEQRYLPVACDDDSGDGYWSQLLVRPLAGERFALRIEETAFPLEGIETYSLLIRPVSLIADAEPNNTSTQATELTLQAEDTMAWRIDGLLDDDDTIDLFALRIEASALVQIYTEPQGECGEYDTLLSLYKPDGTLLATNDDAGDSGWSRVSQLLGVGEYIIAVGIGEYTMPPLPYRLRALATSVRTVSETEPNDTDETSELIQWIPGEALVLEAAIGTEDDIDSFRVILDDAMTVAFETGPRGGSSESNDTTIAIYDADLSEIVSNDDWNESWSRIEQKLEAGTYYIVVDSYYDDEVFDYTLTITQP